MFKNTSKFIEKFSEVAPKFDWYFNRKKYGHLEAAEIVGVKKESDYKEFTPLTAFAEVLTGRYFELDRFDLAATEIGMVPDCATQIVDASDEWPDRVHGYEPKNYEKKLRDEILKCCQLI